MADTSVQNRPQNQGEMAQRSGSGSAGGGLARRGFDPFLSPREFFTNPFAAMRRMHEEMDRMFTETMDPSQQGGGGFGWSPALEVTERNNELCVCAELPGLRPEDVKVEVSDDALIIEGERKQQQERNEQGRYHSERRYGRFYREIPLPEGVNAEQIRAEFNNGELRITMPIQQRESHRRQIPVNQGQQQNQGTQQSQQQQQEDQTRH